MGLTELLLAKQTSSEQREHLRTIQDSANHLNGIINDILDFSKIEAGQARVRSGGFQSPGTARCP